jgi:hypothetical protein
MLVGYHYNADTGITFPLDTNVLTLLFRSFKRLVNAWKDDKTDERAEKLRKTRETISGWMETGLPPVTGKLRFYPVPTEGAMVPILELDDPVTLEFDLLDDIDTMLETGSDEIAARLTRFCDAFCSAIKEIKEKFDDVIDHLHGDLDGQARRLLEELREEERRDKRKR